MKKKIIALFCLLTFLLTTQIAIAYSKSAEDKFVKTKIVFINEKSVSDVVSFSKKNNLKVTSITFRGPTFTCGGTVESIDEIDKLIDQIVANWNNDLIQEKIPASEKDKIKGHIELAKNGQLGVYSLRVEGLIPEGVKEDSTIKVLEK